MLPASRSLLPQEGFDARTCAMHSRDEGAVDDNSDKAGNTVLTSEMFASCWSTRACCLWTPFSLPRRSGDLVAAVLASGTRVGPLEGNSVRRGNAKVAKTPGTATREPRTRRAGRPSTGSA